jgi:hypothetical protein
VLAQEIAVGRVARDDGGYRIVEGCFDADVLAALRALDVLDPDESRPIRRVRELARAS